MTDGMQRNLAILQQHHGQPGISQRQGSDSPKAKQKKRDQKKLRQYQDDSKSPKRPSDYMDTLSDVHRAGTSSGMGGTKAISTIPSHADKEFWKL